MAANTRTFIETMARAGYAARGLVYVIIGTLAILAAFGRGETEGSRGAVETLLAQPFGQVLVWAAVAGLAAFAAWRVLQAVLDADRHGTDAKGLAIRAGLLGSAVTHAALALFALGLVSSWGSEGGSSGDPSGRWLAAAYEAGWGQILVWSVVALLAVVGIAHIVKAWTAKFEKRFEAPADAMRWVRPISRFGLLARGLVFLVIALLVARGGLTLGESAGDAVPGVEEALKSVQSWPFGWLLFLGLAIGLLAFGVYCFAESRYRRIAIAHALP